MWKYTTFLLERFILQYSRLDVQEIHVVFDDPGRLKNHPKAIERAMPRGAMCLLSGSQRLVVAGALQGMLRDTAWYGRQSAGSLPVLNLFGNAEADTRIWLHASKSKAKKLLLFSPDTDTYHTGMTALVVILISR